MNPQPSNANGNGGAVMTLVRLQDPEKTFASEAEVDDVYYSDWTPRKAKSTGNRYRNTSVTSRPPSIIFVRGGDEISETDEPVNLWSNLPLALLTAAVLLYAVPTALEFFAFRHLGPWASTILPGDIAGCLCLGIVFRMRLLGVLLYLFLTASESGLYSFGLIDGDDLAWIADLVPAVFVAAMMTTRPKRCYA